MSKFRRNLLTAMNKTEPPITKDYLTIVALEDGLTAKLSLNACEYCVDGDGNWKSLPADTETESINNGQTLSFRANLTPTTNDGIGTFSINKLHNLKGDCMSLLVGDDAKDCFSLEGNDSAFRKLFNGNDRLVDASELLLKATTLATRCYYSMFQNCKNLIDAPKLPAMVLTPSCYASMFHSCSSLVKAPGLPATTLDIYCCYLMFYYCTSLEAAPDLMATVLKNNCYADMFSHCRRLNYIKMMATNIVASGCLTDWLLSVATTGTFIKNKYATWDVRGTNGIPNGWEIITE